MVRAPMHAAGVKLQNMIKRTRRHLFVFVTNRELPATNNGSERALRPCAVFRKITAILNDAGWVEIFGFLEPRLLIQGRGADSRASPDWAA